MGREIKFRCWVKESKMFMTLDGTNTFEIFTDDDFILMQFTGLKDRNGVDIYEGDIIRQEYFDNAFTDKPKYFVGQVVWSSGGYNFEYIMDGNKKAQGVNIHFNQEHANHFEVIGNIFQNKELLR